MQIQAEQEALLHFQAELAGKERVAGVPTAEPEEEAARRVTNETSGECRLIERDTRSRRILRRRYRQDGVTVTGNRMKKHVMCSSLHALFRGDGGRQQLQTFM